VVDDSMQTNFEGIFAAGDVTEARDFFSGEKNPMPIWPDAYIQGDIAGVSMAGGKKVYGGGLAMNSIEFFKVPTISMGVTNPPATGGYEVHTFQDQESYLYRKMVFRDGRLVGAVLVGAVDRAGILAGLIREQVEITPCVEALLRPDFGFIHLPREIRNSLFAPEGKVDR
jgi:NADPH-dependent 2,4-dienoyl-CoA reductase/sulfur reductase-like enzyme